MAVLIDLERMKERLAELDAEREPLLALIRAAEAYEGAVGRPLFTSPKTTIRAKPGDGAGGGRRAPIMEATEKVVAEVLDMEGPMGTSDLANRIAHRPEVGLPVKNRINVLSARLSNGSKFRSRRGIGWWFVDRPWPDESDVLGLAESPTKAEADVAEDEWSVQLS